MKKLFLLVLFMPILMNAQSQIEICECADIMLAMMKEAKGNMTDKNKMEAIKKKYEAKIEKCEKMTDGKSDEEKNKIEEVMKNCPATKEAEILMKEMMGEAESDADRK
jgi:hypothetical protein